MLRTSAGSLCCLVLPSGAVRRPCGVTYAPHFVIGAIGTAFCLLYFFLFFACCSCTTSFFGTSSSFKLHSLVVVACRSHFRRFLSRQQVLSFRAEIALTHCVLSSAVVGLWQTGATLKHHYFTPTQSQKISPAEEVGALQPHFETVLKKRKK